MTEGRFVLSLLFACILSACGPPLRMPCWNPSADFVAAGESCTDFPCALDFGQVDPQSSSAERITWSAYCGYMEDVEFLSDDERFSVIDQGKNLVDDNTEEGFVLVQLIPVDEDPIAASLTASAGDNEHEFSLTANR